MKASSILIYNNTIHNNNTLQLPEAGSKTLKNTTINSSNNIIIKSLELNNIIINSSNNITLYNNNVSNVTILNNCDGSINLSDNIVVDNYINTPANSSLNTSLNSVYLFGQDVYARSFNTLK